MAGDSIGNAYVTVKPKVDNSFGKEIEEKAAPAGSGFGNKFSSAAKMAIGAGAVAIGNILAGAVQSVASNIGQVFSDMFQGAMDYEQLAGGVEKIFDQANISQIMADANAAYKDLNMSANEYLAAINQTGAAFAQTMGDQKGYDVARTGMKAIADYASGTGRNIDELNEKFSLITRSTSSYQSIADQFSGILPATSKDFLEQAQAAGYLSDSYKSLTDVPIAEYQEAVSLMLEKGVADMGLAGNTAMESAETMSGSLAMLKSSWANLLAGILDENADLTALFGNLLESIGAVVSNFAPRIGLLFVRMFQQLPQALFDAIMALPDTMLPALQAVFGEQMGQAISDDMRSALESATAAIGGLVEGVISAVTPIAEDVMSLFQATWPIISQTVYSAMQFVGGVIETVWPVISDTITSAMATISAIIDENWPAIQELITTVMTTVQDLMEEVWPSIQELISTVMAAIDAVMQVAWPIVQNITSSVMSAVLAIINTVWPRIQGIVTAAVSVITSVINSMSAIVGTVTGIFNSVKNAITNPIETAKNVIKGIIDQIIGFFSGLGSRITSAIGSIHFPQPHISFTSVDIAGVTSISLPSVSWYANGGIVDGATLIGAGEAGPEMILPKDGAMMRDFANAVTSEVNMGEVVDEIRAFRQEIGPIIARYTPGVTVREMGGMLNRDISRNMAGGIAWA